MSGSDKRPDDGGPAFPRTGNYSTHQESKFDSLSQDGMMLWDYYAAAALRYCRGGDYSSFADVATECGNIADAMLAERRKRGIGSN